MRKFQGILFIQNYLLGLGIEQFLKNDVGISSILRFSSFSEFENTIQQLSDSIVIIEDELFDLYKTFIVENPNIFANSKVVFIKKDKQTLLANYELVDSIIECTFEKAELLDVINGLLKQFPSKDTSIKSEKRELSDREKTIVKLVALGKTANEIAEELYLSSHTVITHRKNISKKLGIKTVSGLTVYAILNNIVSFEEINK